MAALVVCVGCGARASYPRPASLAELVLPANADTLRRSAAESQGLDAMQDWRNERRIGR